MASAQQISALAAVNCDVGFDNLTRQLYATDASIYQIEPMAVAFPRSTKQAVAIMQGAAQAGIPVIPAAQAPAALHGALGEGLIVDFSRYNKQISDIDLQARTRAGRVGGRSGPSQSVSASLRFLFWPGRGHEFASDDRRDDCQ